MSRPVTPIASHHDLAVTDHVDDSMSGGRGYSTSRPVSTARQASTSRPVSTSRPQSYLSSGPVAATGFDQSASVPDEHDLASQNADLYDHGLDVRRGSPEIRRSVSQMSQSQPYTPSKAGTLKKKPSLKKSASIVRSASRRSSFAPSVKSAKAAEKATYTDPEENNSVFYCPVPTSGNPTELLANRFQAWRKVLKDLIMYFRDLNKAYETKSKNLLSASSIINSASMPSSFIQIGGLGESAVILREMHKQALVEAQKAKDLENEIVIQLTGLRSDLQQKIKEIKNLSGDFKNNVDKEQESTKRVVRSLEDALATVDRDGPSTTGKGDPFIVKMGVERQVEKQLEEENYLHRAYLNLESSGRELESIVVGEIQKAYNAYAAMLRREADLSYEAAEKLKAGPLALEKDFEWDQFTASNNQMIDPRKTVRSVENITYPGKDHPAGLEVKSGMLERKSKYLKNYTPGWYILSPTHLHEFRSADRISSQNPVMSLYLPEQKLGSHSEPGSSSHKFMLKGRQTGSMHRGHSWVFRAESHDTMMAWFSDIKELTEKRGEDRNEFVRRSHARSLSGNSFKPASAGAGSSDGMEEDEADKVPYSSEQSIRGQSVSAEAGAAPGGLGPSGLSEMDDNRSEAGWRPPQPRASPGGKFEADVDVERGLRAPLSPSSEDSSDAVDKDHDVIMAASALPGSGMPFTDSQAPYTQEDPMEEPHHLYAATPKAEDPSKRSIISHDSIHNAVTQAPGSRSASAHSYQHADFRHGPKGPPARDSQSNYGEWMAPAAAGAVAGAVVAGTGHYYEDHDRKVSQLSQPPMQQEPAISSQQTQPIEMVENVKTQMEAAGEAPLYGASSPPIVLPSEAPLETPTRSRGVTESTQAATLVGSTTYAEDGVSRSGGSLSAVQTNVDGDAYNTYKGLGMNGAIYADQRNDVATKATEVLPVAAMVGGITRKGSELKDPVPSSSGISPDEKTITSPGSTDSVPERPKIISGHSVQTISDLHVPGEYPKRELA